MERKQRRTSLALLAGIALVAASIGSAFAQDGPQEQGGRPMLAQGGPDGGPGGGQGGFGQRQGGGRMMRRGGAPRPVSLLFMPREVFTKLDLSDEEVDKIEAARKAFDEKHRPDQAKQTKQTERPSREQMEAKRKSLEAEVQRADEALMAQLSDGHRTVVAKLVKDMKVMQSVHLPAHLVLDLKLTDDQITKLAAAAPTDSTKVDPDDLRDKVESILTKRQKKILRSAGPQGGPGGGQEMAGGRRGQGGPDGGPEGGPDGGPGGGPEGGPDGGPQGGPPPGGEGGQDANG